MLEEIEQQTEAWQKKQLTDIHEIDIAEAKLKESLNRLNAENDMHKTRIISIRSTCEELVAKIKTQHKNIAAVRARIEALQHSVSIFGKLFKSAIYKEVQKGVAQEYEVQAQCLQQVDILNKEIDRENQKAASVQAQIDSLTAKICEESGRLKELQLSLQIKSQEENEEICRREKGYRKKATARRWPVGCLN